jgi:hypothetical protein
MRHTSPGLPAGARSDEEVKIHPAGDQLRSQSSASNRQTARAISDEALRHWLNERLNQPHLYDLEAELLKAETEGRWSA